MAAGGGTFITTNKVLPGAYINFVSKARALGTLGERGIVALPFSGKWGKNDEVITLSSEDFQTNCFNTMGYSYTDDEMLFLREVFKGANTAKLFRISSGEKAKATLGSITITAICAGTRGNDIKVIVEKNVDDSTKFNVRTVVGNDLIEVDEQIVSKAEDLIPNDFISFSGTGSLTASAGIKLSGGTDTNPTGDSYSKFLDKIEAENFTTILYAGDDDTTKGLFTSFVKRLRDDEGYKVTCVLSNYTSADYEGIISVKNKTVSNTSELVYWVAGKTAGAEVNESLTNSKYDGELKINTSFKKSELKAAIENGEFIFYGEKDSIKVLRDINTFTSFTVNKNSDFSNNQVIRVLDIIANDIAEIFDNYYLGKVQNNELGRDIFKSEIINYHNELQAIEAIENFSAEDVTVKAGTEKGDVIVNEYIEPISAMEKLYMTCIVE